MRKLLDAQKQFATSNDENKGATTVNRVKNNIKINMLIPMLDLNKIKLKNQQSKNPNDVETQYKETT